MQAGRELAQLALLLKPPEKHRAAQGIWYLPDIESPKLLNSFMYFQSKCLTLLHALKTIMRVCHQTAKSHLRIAYAYIQVELYRFNWGTPFSQKKKTFLK